MSDAEKAYKHAASMYAGEGVDAERALSDLKRVSLSLPCWQGDDVRGFESPDAALDGGLAATGDYPGKARTADELRADLEAAFALIPGRHRANIHAIYAETGGKKVERDELAPEHFTGWVDWAKGLALGMDFNPTFFSHPKARDGFTLGHADKVVREFWVGHGVACRRIGAAMGRALGSACVTNVWVPDGYKDTPADRFGPRERLVESLDAVFAEALPEAEIRDSVEGKLFGIGSESYVAGSHDFYLAYAVSRGKMLCLDMGHYHPTESVSDKIPAVLLFLDEILLHVSRGVRWDSDHVATFSDELRAVAGELVRGGFLDRVHIGLDFFDASINRVAAWVIGARSTLKSLLAAMLEPASKLRELEAAGRFTERLALLEAQKTMPLGAVWDEFCRRCDTPAESKWTEEILRYERDVLAKRA